MDKKEKWIDIVYIIQEVEFNSFHCIIYYYHLSYIILQYYHHINIIRFNSVAFDTLSITLRTK